MIKLTADRNTRDLQWFNALSTETAIHELLQCCGSLRWARQVVHHRPFETIEHLISTAGAVWRALTAEDWLEAFNSHPKIGESKAAQSVSALAQTWSAQEQAAVDLSGQGVNQELTRLNSEYEAKFGYIFIVCASGRSSDEVLRVLHNRLTNDASREILIAASEQEKITKLRLQKLLDQNSS